MNRIVNALLVPVILALTGAAIKLYVDVEILKTKFEYVNGRWETPHGERH